MSSPEITALEALDDLDGYRVIDVREEYEFHGPLGFIDRAELASLSTVEENVVMLAMTRLRPQYWPFWMCPRNQGENPNPENIDRLGVLNEMIDEGIENILLAQDGDLY